VAFWGVWLPFKQGYNKPLQTSQSKNRQAYSNGAPKSAYYKDENKAKGDAFENYVVSLFDTTSGRFELKEWRSDKIASTGMYPTSNKQPDLQFEFHGYNRTHKFAIECKWRSDFYLNGVDWAKPHQIQNYLEYERKTRIKVFVVIGVGGSPNLPAKMYLAPLKNVAQYSTLFESYLKQFERNPKHGFSFAQHTDMLM